MEELDKMVKYSEKYAGEDLKRKEEVEVRNQADTLIYATEKSMKDLGDKLSDSDKKNIESKLSDAKEALKGKDVDKIKKSMEELTKASHKLAEEVYKKTAQQKAGTTSGGQSPKEEPSPKKEAEDEKKGDDVIDAEYKVENEDKDKK